MPYAVITHAGKAHIDEILAAAVLAVHLGEPPSEVRRMNSADAADMVAAGDVPENAWVIDCGMAYNPGKRLFDHHQDRNLPSAALMLFRHCFPELAGTDLEARFETVSKVDTRGVRSLIETELTSESRDYWSFSQQLLTKAFESDPAAALRVASLGLTEKIVFEEHKKAAAEWIAVPGRLVAADIDGLAALEYKDAPPEGIADGLKGIDGGIIERLGAVVVYGFDKTDPGIRTLYRTDIGHDLIDFTQSSPKDALFNHQGGFLLRFRPADEEEWMRIVRDSRIVPDIPG